MPLQIQTAKNSSKTAVTGKKRGGGKMSKPKRMPQSTMRMAQRNELPRSKLRDIKPPLADSYGPASLAGGYSCSVWMACRRTLEQPQLDVLAMQLRIILFTALLPHILAD